MTKRPGLNRLTLSRWRPVILVALCSAVGAVSTCHGIALGRAATAGKLNAIQLENQRPGTRAWIITQPAESGEIAGYASVTTALAGERVHVYVSTSADSYTADVYRMGWYGGLGGRLVASIKPRPGRRYATPPPDSATGLIQPRWPPAFTLTVSRRWLSGIYMVKLTASSGYQSYVPLVVADHRHSKILYIRGLATDEAYNDWGGKSLYGDSHYPYGSAAWSSHRAYKVTFERPYTYGEDAGSGLFFRYEYNMVRWLEKRGYDVSYSSDVDLDRHPNQVLHHRALIIAGHDEYWSLRQRNALQMAVAHQVSLAVFGGDTGVWQVRYEASGSVPDAVEVCYREAALDPMYGKNNKVVTTHWQDPPVNRPPSALLGEGGVIPDAGQVSPPAAWRIAASRSWVFAGANVHDGTAIPGLVGYEYDRVVPGMPRPAGLTVIARSPVSGIGVPPNISESTVYKAPSGALVVDMGSIDWPWGLDDFYPGFPNFPFGIRPRVASRDAQIIASTIINRMQS